jgi:hypothetical protein
MGYGQGACLPAGERVSAFAEMPRAGRSYSTQARASTYDDKSLMQEDWRANHYCLD